jgi:hypothetical protein
MFFASLLIQNLPMAILLFMSECNYRNWYKKRWDTFNYYSFTISELVKEEFMIKFHSSQLKSSTNKVNILVSKNYWIDNHSLLLTEIFYYIDKNYSDNFISSYSYLAILLSQSLTNMFSCSYYKHFFLPILLHLIFGVLIRDCVLCNWINNVPLFYIKHTQSLPNFPVVTNIFKNILLSSDNS